MGRNLGLFRAVRGAELLPGWRLERNLNFIQISSLLIILKNKYVVDEWMIASISKSRPKVQHLLHCYHVIKLKKSILSVSVETSVEAIFIDKQLVIFQFNYKATANKTLN